MSASSPYIPQAVFSTEEGEEARVPRVLIAPQRYVQGDGILDHLGRYLSIVPSERVATILAAWRYEMLQSAEQAQVTDA